MNQSIVFKVVIRIDLTDILTTKTTLDNENLSTVVNSFCLYIKGHAQANLICVHSLKSQTFFENQAKFEKNM